MMPSRANQASKRANQASTGISAERENFGRFGWVNGREASERANTVSASELDANEVVVVGLEIALVIGAEAALVESGLELGTGSDADTVVAAVAEGTVIDVGCDVVGVVAEAAAIALVANSREEGGWVVAQRAEVKPVFRA